MISLMLALPFLPFGLLIGLLGRMLAGPKVGGVTVVSWLPSLLAGAVGAVVGGILGRVVLLDRAERPQGFALSLLGALVLVVAYHAVLRWRLETAEPGRR
jgi:uncharacterized membrane protein YeaQ/YmgE (transglycosylase-associated protein family)